jgi:hypothetical protein
MGGKRTLAWPSNDRQPSTFAEASHHVFPHEPINSMALFYEDDQPPHADCRYCYVEHEPSIHRRRAGAGPDQEREAQGCNGKQLL